MFTCQVKLTANPNRQCVLNLCCHNCRAILLLLLTSELQKKNALVKISVPIVAFSDNTFVFTLLLAGFHCTNRSIFVSCAARFPCERILDVFETIYAILLHVFHVLVLLLHLWLLAMRFYLKTFT